MLRTIFGAFFRDLFFLVHFLDDIWRRKQCREVLHKGFKETANITIPVLPSPRYSSVGCLIWYEERSPGKVEAKRGFQPWVTLQGGQTGGGSIPGTCLQRESEPKNCDSRNKALPLLPKQFHKYFLLPFLYTGKGFKGSI